MQTIRINNVPLFVTVLSACLLAVGAPTQVYAQPAQSVDLFSASIESRKCDTSVRRLAKRLTSHNASVGIFGEPAPHERTLDQVFFENTRALTQRNTVIIVTRLPRGGLSGSLIKSGQRREERATTL